MFTSANVKPGDTVLIQGAGGGVSTAAIQLAHAAGLEVFVTSRSEEKRDRAIAIGADAAFETGARLPHKVDAVIESVGAATWSHSVKSVRPGGTIAICGATTGDQPGAELTRIFFQDIRVQGNTMGSRDDFAQIRGTRRPAPRHRLHLRACRRARGVPQSGRWRRFRKGRAAHRAE